MLCVRYSRTRSHTSVARLCLHSINKTQAARTNIQKHINQHHHCAGACSLYVCVVCRCLSVRMQNELHRCGVRLHKLLEHWNAEGNAAHVSAKGTNTNTINDTHTHTIPWMTMHCSAHIRICEWSIYYIAARIPHFWSEKIRTPGFFKCKQIHVFWTIFFRYFELHVNYIYLIS